MLVQQDLKLSDAKFWHYFLAVIAMLKKYSYFVAEILKKMKELPF